MASQGWLCRRVRCGTRNEPAKKKCVGCGGARPKKRVPAHKQALRDVTYLDYITVSEEIHGVVGEYCCVCEKGRDGRRLDRDHDHTTGASWSGKPRGLVCVRCNLLMPPKLTPEIARLIAAYLTRVEAHYEQEAA